MFFLILITFFIFSTLSYGYGVSRINILPNRQIKLSPQRVLLNHNCNQNHYRLFMAENKIEVVEEDDDSEISESAVINEIPENETEEQKYKREKLAEIAERKAKEVFFSQQTGKYECQACGYVYDEAKGYAKKGIEPGTPFDQIDKFRCPECGANKKYFVAETQTISGFKENLNYGFGTNKMTGGQKGNLIFGGLFLGFLLFMSGYLLD